MPVSIDDFEAGNLPDGPTVPEEVVRFLVAHRDKAFTRSEIATAIDADTNTVGTALTRLKNRELVRHRGEYWAIADDTDRVISAYDLHTASESRTDEDGSIGQAKWDEAAPDEPHPSERSDG